MKQAYLIGVSAAALAGGFSHAPVMAQDMAPPQAASAQARQSSSDSQVGDIIVTAQRVAQPMQRVPVAVQAVSGDELEARKLNDLTQMALSVPSLGTGTDNSYALRGVGSLIFSPNVDSSVGISIDEVSLGIPVYMNEFAFEDVARVEVLMGPQGLLFGRNSSAGLLNVVSQRPVFGEFSGRVYAEQDYRDTLPGKKWGTVLKGTVNLPISSIAALRINAIYSDQDALTRLVARRNVGKFQPYQHRAGIRAKLLVEPTDDLSFYVVADYAEKHGIGGSFDRTHRQFGPGSITQIFATRDGVTAGPDNFDFGTSSLFQDLKTGGVSATLAYDISDRLTISNIAAYRGVKFAGNFDGDYTSSDGVDVGLLDFRYDQYSNELRLSLNPGGLIDGQAGLYYFGSRLDRSQVVGAAAFGVAGPFDSYTNPLIGQDVVGRLTGDSYAAFGQMNVHATDALTLIAGGRVTRDKLRYRVTQNTKFYPVALGVRNFSADQTVRNTDFSWKLGAQYQATPDVMAYATYGKGYKGPTFNDSATIAGQDLAVGPETAKSLELGVKTTLLDRKLRLNVAAFRQLFDGFQVQGFDSRANSYFTANGANVKSQGIEIQAEARPTRALTITAAATILDAKFRSFTTDRCYPGQTPCAANGTTDSTGNRTPSSARFTSTIGAAYTVPVSADANLVLSGDYYHRSSVYFSTNNNPTTRLGGIDILGASLALNVGDRFNFSIFCKNCTDKKFPLYIEQDSIDGVVANTNSTLQSWGYNSVRTIGVSTSVRF